LSTSLFSLAISADELQNAMRVEIEQLRFSGQLSLGDVDIASGELLAEFYERRNFSTAWNELEQFDALLAAIENSYLEGFNPADYHLDKLRKARSLLSTELTHQARAVIDLALTDSLIRLGYHHRFGKVNPYNLDPHWNFERTLSERDPVDVLQHAIDSANIEETLEALFPRVPMYTGLQNALARYRQLAGQGGWPTVSDGPTIKPGATDPRLPIIRERLLVTNDIAATGTTQAPAYGEILQQAVRRFQFRHGLEEDGVIGPATLAAMNVPAQRRVGQLRASLERARWVVHSVTDDYIVVNIAGFNTRLVRNGQTEWEAKVQVGSEYHKTPVFRDELKYIVLNPTWTVPYSIATKEMLPRIQREADYFEGRDFDIKNRDGQLVAADSIDWQSLSRGNFGYTFVQRSGPNNALGQVKFIFPNEHSVYLHDTPSKALFDKAKRAFSHGCIRVEQPMELAQLLLADKGWDNERIAANKETETIFLSQPLTVLIMYWTASVLPDGTVQFFDDIYERDDAVLNALAAPFTMERPQV
jgi:murein L,D-transpeptidase YcbB/YkuD